MVDAARVSPAEWLLNDHGPWRVAAIFAELAGHEPKHAKQTVRDNYSIFHRQSPLWVEGMLNVEKKMEVGISPTTL